MARIAVIGGSRYAGRRIVAEAADRGHTVLSIARRLPAERHTGVMYVEGSLTDVPDLVAQLIGVDVVVSAVAAREEMAGLVRPNITALLGALPEDVRLGVVGAAISGLITAEGERVVDLPSVAEDYVPEALEAIGILDDLKAEARSRDWFFVHPAGGFGGWDLDEPSGEVNGDLVITDAEGSATVSGTDLAGAVLDEIESPRRSRD